MALPLSAPDDALPPRCGCGRCGNEGEVLLELTMAASSSGLFLGKQAEDDNVDQMEPESGDGGEG